MSEIPSGFNPESVSKTTDLAREIKTIKVVGDSSPESDQKARDFLQEKFDGKYESVEQMIEITQDGNRSEEARKNAEKALDQLGSAILLAGDDKVEELAATGQLSVNLPPSLRGIDAKVNSNLFMRDASDETGKKIVIKLREMEAFNVKAKVAPNMFEKRREAFTQEKIDDLFEELSSVSEDSEDAAKLGAVIGYLDSTIPVANFGRRKNPDGSDFVPPTRTPDGDWEGGARWEISPEFAAEAMKFMDSGMRWQSYTPPEWFKNLPPRRGKNGEVESRLDQQKRIEYMVVINNAAAGLLYAGKDLDKMIGNKATFGFTHEQMSCLFNNDFKLIMSKILNDLCEPYVDQNGVECLRYKEVDVFDKEGRFVKRVIDKDVQTKIEFYQNYEDSLADFIAKQNGREKADYMDKMNASTAWNMWFAMGDSSLADRMRILPTWDGVIADSLRTLNPEYKALGKWMVKKTGLEKNVEDIFNSEYFSGPLADYVLGIMKLERDLNKPIDGVKTLREKILDGDVSFLGQKTLYGFFDFVNGGRDLVDGNGNKFYDKYDTNKKREVSLGKLIMNYASFDKDGELIEKKTGSEFSFGQEQTTFMNEFRDSLDAAIVVNNCSLGRVELKDPTSWARTIKDKFGMVNGIEFNGYRPFQYTRSPELWRDMIIGSFGANLDRLSSDHVAIPKPTPKSGSELNYASYLFGMLTTTFNLSDNDINLNKLMRLLGVDIKDGENPESISVETRTAFMESKEESRSNKFSRKQKKSFTYGKKDAETNDYVRRVNNAKRYPGNNDYELLIKSFNKIVDGGDKSSIERFTQLIENFDPNKNR
ncbi:MAG: hypothetical protein WCG91_03570 [Candidatus Shapirobacteria bacterium]